MIQTKQSQEAATATVVVKKPQPKYRNVVIRAPEFEATALKLDAWLHDLVNMVDGKPVLKVPASDIIDKNFRLTPKGYPSYRFEGIKIKSGSTWNIVGWLEGKERDRTNVILYYQGKNGKFVRDNKFHIEVYNTVPNGRKALGKELIEDEKETSKAAVAAVAAAVVEPQK